MTSKIGGQSLAGFISGLSTETKKNAKGEQEKLSLRHTIGLLAHFTERQGNEFGRSDGAVKACVKKMVNTLDNEFKLKTNDINVLSGRVALVKETSAALEKLETFWLASKGTWKGNYSEKFAEDIEKVKKWELDLEGTLNACTRAQAKQGGAATAKAPSLAPVADQASKTLSQQAAALNPKAQSTQSRALPPDNLPATRPESREKLSLSAAYVLNSAKLNKTLQEELNGGSLESGYKIEIEVLESYLTANPGDAGQIGPLIAELKVASARAKGISTVGNGINKLPRDIGNDIKQLTVGQSLVVPGGYYGKNGGGHAVAYKVTRDADNSYSFTVINTGEGTEKHQTVAGSQGSKVKDLRYAGFSQDAISKFGFWTELVGYRAGMTVEDGKAVQVDYESMAPVYKTIEEHSIASGIKNPDHQNAAERKLQSQGNCFFKCVAGYVDSRLSEELKAKVKVHGTVMHIAQLRQLKAPSEIIAAAEAVLTKRQNKIKQPSSSSDLPAEAASLLGNREVKQIKPGFFTRLMTSIMNFFKNLFRSKDKAI